MNPPTGNGTKILSWSVLAAMITGAVAVIVFILGQLSHKADREELETIRLSVGAAIVRLNAFEIMSSVDHAILERMEDSLKRIENGVNYGLERGWRPKVRQFGRK